jgi:hypothetical protein
MKYSSSFTHDLNFGELAEDWVKNIFSNGSKVEVKCDTKAHSTGNIFIEFESRGKPSGIATTDADYWVYKIDEVGFAIIFEVEILKAKLRKYYTDGMYLKKGGDNDTSKGFLVPIIQLFKK